MENQIFSPRRFAAYMKKYAVEQRKNILILAATVSLLLIFFCVAYPYIFNTYKYSVSRLITDPMWSTEMTFFIYVGFGISLACGSFYSLLKKKQSRLSLLTCPASSFEKFLTFFCIFVIALPLIGVASIFLGDAIRVWIYSGSAAKWIPVEYISPSYLFTFGHANHFVIGMLWFGFLFNQSIFALGSSVWPKNSIIKTVCFILVFNIVSGILLSLGMKCLISMRGIHEINFMYTFSDTQLTWIFYSVLIFVTLSAWAISYFRFKEWEIIKRW